PLANCPVFDSDHNGTVTIDELLVAVGLAVRGCPATPTFTPSPDPTITATITQTLTATPPPTTTPTLGLPCGTLQPPTSFGRGFVDLTTDVEADLIPVPTPPPHYQPFNVPAFFNDLDGDGIMEVIVGQDAWPQTTDLVLLRYNPSTGKLARDYSAVL